MLASRLPHTGAAPRAPRRAIRGAGGALLLAAAACARGGAAPPDVRTPAGAPALGDGLTSMSIAPGVVHRTFTMLLGPQVVHVLDVDLARCWTPLALKAGSAAVGRAGTLALVRAAGDSVPVAGGVNADFFSFQPPGVPVSAHVQRGRVIAGPSARPVLAVDSTGRASIATLRVEGWVALPRVRAADARASDAADTIPLAALNRAAPGGLALFDGGWGGRTDSAPGRLFVHASPTGHAPQGAGAMQASIVGRVDSGATTTIAAGEAFVLVAGADAQPASRARLGALRRGDTLVTHWRLAPLHPREAVGGFPLLVRDGAIDPGVDSAGTASFRGPNPRTAVGVAGDGRRLLLVTVDGRQPGYSAGMTLRELAALLRSLGARDALNLDGGGSTTFVVAPGGGEPRIANQPSDSAGERPVGNALAVARTCAAGSPGAREGAR